MVKILIVEDDMNELYFWKRELRGVAEILEATTLQEAYHFLDTEQFDVVVMDACLQSNNINTSNLTREVRRSFKGPMIASSSDPAFRKELVVAGCDYNCPKEFVGQKIKEILKEISTAS